MDAQQIIELMWKNVSEASSVLQKGLTFYLAILAGTTGYIFSVDLADDDKFALFLAVLLISFFAAVASAALSYGIWFGLKEIAALVSSGNTDEARRVYQTFNLRGRVIGLVIMGGMAGVLITMLVSLMLAII